MKTNYSRDLNKHIKKTIILETTKKEIERDLVPDKISNLDFEKYIFNSNKSKFIKPFTDNDYLQVLYNSFIENQNYEVKDFVQIYPIVKEKILDPSRSDKEFLKKLTYDNIKELLGEKLKNNFKSISIRNQCQYENKRPIVGTYKDFNVHYSGDDWIIIEPKTVRGSIAWAHGKPDGSEETDQIRRVRWCTGTKNENHFTRYASYLHMFYLIKTNYESDNSDNRRLCLSFYKDEYGKVILSKRRQETVDANNSNIIAKKLKNVLSKNLIYNLYNIVSKREETQYVDKYVNTSLEQTLNKINQMKNNNVSKKVIEEEISRFIKYTKSKDVLMSLYNTDRENLLFAIAGNQYLFDMEVPGYLIKKIINSQDEKTNIELVKRQDILEIDPTGTVMANAVYKISGAELAIEIIGDVLFRSILENDIQNSIFKSIIDENNEELQIYLAMEPDLYLRGIPVEVLRGLAGSKSRSVGNNLAKNPNLFKLDPEGEIINILKRTHKGYPGVVEVLDDRIRLKENLLKKYIKLILN